MENLYYTIVGPPETTLEIVHPQSPFALTTLWVKGIEIKVDRQQLMELGALFLALAGNTVDFDSASELLEGYGLSIKEAWNSAYKLKAALEP